MMDQWHGTTTLEPITGSPTPSGSIVAVQMLVDHSRHFRLPPKRTPAVSVSAPYLRSLLSEYGNAKTIVTTVHGLAAELGLRVRVGSDDDNVYRLDEPVLPIVWWNASRLELEAVEVGAFISRWNEAHPDQESPA